MSLDAVALRKLAGLGLSPEQMAGVLEVLASMTEAEDARKAAQRERTARYRERLDITPSDWETVRNAVISRDGLVCAYCGDRDGPFDVDHIVAVSRGGASVLENLCVSCRSCNASKGGKLLSEWDRP